MVFQNKIVREGSNYSFCWLISLFRYSVPISQLSCSHQISLFNWNIQFYISKNQTHLCRKRYSQLSFYLFSVNINCSVFCIKNCIVAITSIYISNVWSQQPKAMSYHCKMHVIYLLRIYICAKFHDYSIIYFQVKYRLYGWITRESLRLKKRNFKFECIRKFSNLH